MVGTKLEGYFFTAILIGALVIVAYLFLPYLGALAVALVTAVLLYPLHCRIQRLVRHEAISAFLSVLLASVLLIVPATLLVYLIVQEVRALTAMFASADMNGVFTLLAPFESVLQDAFPALFDLNIRTVMVEALGIVSRNLGGAFASTAHLLLGLFVSLIALYYFLKDGRRFVRLIIMYSPLADRDDHAVLQKLDMVMHSLIRGGLVIAVLQGLLTGIGFYLFGLPSPILWGSVAGIAAILPTIGTAFVTLPAFLWLLVSASLPEAFLFAAYGLMIIGLVDNILGPRIIGRGKGVEIHPLPVLLSVLGGLGVFGAPGFLIGPMVLAFLIALMHIYAQKIPLIEEVTVLAPEDVDPHEVR